MVRVNYGSTVLLQKMLQIREQYGPVVTKGLFPLQPQGGRGGGSVQKSWSLSSYLGPICLLAQPFQT